MGITIHYSGRLHSQEAYESLITRVRSFAETRHWEVFAIEEKVRELTYFLPRLSEANPAFDPEDVDEVLYTGLTKGVRVEPHPDCESLTFLFDRDLYFENFTKTQFAGLGIHIAIIELFRQLVPLFSSLRIEDEGEYWETNDAAVLAENFDASTAAIKQVMDEYAG